MQHIRQIAIDGTCGVGKSTTAQFLGNKLRMRVLDAGAMYRGLAYVLTESGFSPKSCPTNAWADYAITFNENNHITIDGHVLEPHIRTEQIGQLASQFSKIPGFKPFIFDKQQEIVNSSHGWVAEGRDIALHVMPNADVKIYLWADPQVRAKRRLLQEGKEVTPDSLLSYTAYMRKRDKIDYTNPEGALVKLKDAHKHYDYVVETTHLTLDQQLTHVLELLDVEIARRVPTIKVVPKKPTLVVPWPLLTK